MNILVSRCVTKRMDTLLENMILKQRSIFLFTINEQVYRISLFAHSHIDVSNKLNIVNRTEELNRSITDGEAFELSINLDDYTSTLVPGKSYYFRIGAQSHGSETKYNYSASVQLDI